MNPLPEKSEPPDRGFYQNMRPNTKEQTPNWVSALLLYWRGKGLE